MLTSFKFIQRLATPVPVNSAIAEGDRVDEALNKLQGQMNNTQQVFINEQPAIAYPAVSFSDISGYAGLSLMSVNE